MAELKGLLDSAKRKIGGLLGDFPAGFNSGAVAGIAGYPGDIAYMLDTAGRAITGQDTQPAAQDFPGTTDYIAAKAGYPIPGSFSGQLGAAVGGMLTPGPGDLAKFAPVLSAIPFWHGSPHKYDAVDLSKIGTGEGAQAYGHGYYGADTKSVAEGYAKALAEANPHGSWREGEVQFEIRPADMGGTDFEIVKWAGNKSGDAEYGGVIGKGFKSDADATKHLVDSGAVSKDYASKWDELSESTLISESQKNLYRGEYRWPDPAKEAATPLTGEDLLQWDRPLSEQPESVRKALLNPGPSKSLGDVGAGNSDNASYLLESSAAAAKSGGGGNVPLDAVMSNRMGGMLDNGKVANPVVGLVPVDVVDVLTSGKLSPNGALDSNAMNLDLTPSNGGNSVPFGVNAAGSPVGGITRPSFAENAGVGGDVIGVPKNTLAALRAGDLDKRSGHEIYRAIADELGSDKAASDYLTNGNVLGIRYLDGMSRDGGKGTYNYVMFDDKGIKLLERNGTPIEDFAARRAGKAKPYKELAMDEASRMQRAQEMGFDVDNPVYHGTRTKGDAIDAFDLEKAGSKTDAGYMGKGIYFGNDKTANVYAGHYEFDPGHFPEGGAVYPSYLALKSPLRLDDKIENGRSVDLELLARDALGLPREATAEQVTQEALRQGYDGAIYSRGAGKYQEYVVYQPEKIRSKFAAFDPAKKDSANLLAGLAALGVGTAAVKSQQDKERRNGL